MPLAVSLLAAEGGPPRGAERHLERRVREYRPSARATVNGEPGTVPFAISFDPFGHLVIAEAGTNALSAFQLSRNGTVSLLDRTPTGQAAACWVTVPAAVGGEGIVAV